MKLLRSLVAAFVLACLGVSAHAASTINPNVPANNSLLSSAVVRGNFAAAYNDVSNILGKFAGATPPTVPTAMQDWVNTSGGSTYTFNFWNPFTSSWVQWGSLNTTTGVFSSSASVAVNSSLIFTGTTLGINPAHSNVYTAFQAVNLNSSALQASQTGAVFQAEQATGVVARIELDTYGAGSRFTCVRQDGTSIAPTALQSADEMCSLNAFGNNGTSIVGPQAAVRAYAAQNWSVGANGTYLRFGVTSNGSATLTDALSIEQNGGVTIGTTVGTSMGIGTVNISGNYYVNGAAAATNVNGFNCPINGSCTITAAAGTIAIGTTTISGGPGVLYNASSGAVLAAYTTTGTAGSVVLSGSPTFTGTPILATPTATSMAVGGAVVGSNALAVTGTTQLNSALIYGGVTLSNGVTGTGNMVLDTSATLNTAALTSPTISSPVLSGTLTGTYTIGGSPSIPGSAINSGTVSGSFLSAINLASTSNGGVTGILPIAGGGTGAATAPNAITALMPTPTRTGDIAVWNGSIWTTLAGNNAGTQVVSENASGVIAWLTASGSGTVISAGFAAGSGISLSGTNPITSTGTITITGAVPAPQGRITLAANIPVMGPTSCSGSACANQSTLRYDCYIGGGVPYFNGTIDLIDTITSCEVTDAMVAAASAGQVVVSQVYDVWWIHGGANRICVAMSSATGGGGGWASDTGGSNAARGTGYSQLDQVTRPYTTNKNAIPNCFNGSTNYGSVAANQGTYLGTFYATANGVTSFVLGGNASGGVAGFLLVWNMYNQVDIAASSVDSGASYNTSTGLRIARGSAGNAISIVTGMPTNAVSAQMNDSVETAAAVGAELLVGIGLDAVGAISSPAAYCYSSGSSAVAICSLISILNNSLIGFHTYSRLEEALVDAGQFDVASTATLNVKARM